MGSISLAFRESLAITEMSALFHCDNSFRESKRIWEATRAKITTPIDMAKMIVVSLLDLLWVTKFFLTSMSMLFFSQNKKAYVKTSSSVYLRFAITIVRPSIIPKRMPRKMARAKEMFLVSNA